MNLKILHEKYIQEIKENLWVFWEKSYDDENGGVFTCYTNDGKTLISHDKYTWSQGRFLWLCSQLFQLCSEDKLNMNSGKLKEMADHTYYFMKQHVIMPNFHVRYAVTGSGQEINELKDISIYADYFFVLGINQYAKVFGSLDAFLLALKVYRQIRKRISEKNFRTEPYPIPEGFESHSLYMIQLNVLQELYQSANLLEHESLEELRKDTIASMTKIIDEFINENETLIELKPKEVKDTNTLLARHINPGHTLESLWFILHSQGLLAEKQKKTVRKNMAKIAIKTLEVGWDKEYGGLLRFVDSDGGQPKGHSLNDKYETLIKETWDLKLWWPHSEALYTLLLLYVKTKDKRLLEWYEKMEEYTFQTFPNPDRNIKEWIQIRDRKGDPYNKVVALPVKDPFHIIRNFILIINLLKQDKHD